MSLKNYSREELEVTSMLELASEILHDEQKAQNFNDLYNKVAELKGFTDEQKMEFIAQFYTDLTVDGRFLTIESDVWGLKRWYPVEQMDEIVTSPEPKKKKKAKKKKKKKEEVPREQPEEGDLDKVDDNVEILTNKFEDEVLDERDDSTDNTGFDDEFEEDEDDFDDDDFDDSDEEEDNK